MIIHIFHPFKQFGIHDDVVAVLREQGRHLQIDGLHVIVGARFDLGVEHIGHLVEQFATAVECGNGVFECGCFLVVDDGCHLLLLFLHPFDEGRFVVLGLDELKWWNAMWCGIFAKKRITAFGHHRAAHHQCRTCCDNCLFHIQILVND